MLLYWISAKYTGVHQEHSTRDYALFIYWIISLALPSQIVPHLHFQSTFMWIGSVGVKYEMKYGHVCSNHRQLKIVDVTSIMPIIMDVHHSGMLVKSPSAVILYIITHRGPLVPWNYLVLTNCLKKTWWHDGNSDGNSVHLNWCIYCLAMSTTYRNKTVHKDIVEI